MSIITKIDNINHQGQGITKINNKITFVPKTIPEDIVEIKLTKEHKNYNDAKLVKIISPSPNRKDYKCPYYQICGGCHIANLPYELQLKYKQEKVKNIFKKYNKKEIEPEIIPSPNQLHYRNKVILKIKNNKLGLYEEKSHNIIPIDNCLLLPTKMNSIIKSLNNISLYNIDNIMIREIDSQIIINITSNDTQTELINILKDKVTSIYINYNLVYGKPNLTQTLDNYNFIISPESFFQINIDQTINLYHQVLEYSNPKKTDKILDLYCGTGTIGIYLAKHCKEVLGIEINNKAIENANQNKSINKINNISFKQGNVSTVLDINYKADIIIVDPPRSGLDKTVVKTILKIKPRKIVYISCEPITLSRDINLLEENYNLEKIKLFDMFPQTYHVESICLLNLR